MSADLSRLAAALANRYRIERELGVGGMATGPRMNSLLGNTSPAATSGARDWSGCETLAALHAPTALASRSDALPSSEFIRGEWR